MMLETSEVVVERPPNGLLTVEERNALVLRHQGLVHMIAQKFKFYGVAYDDLVQEGMLGLLRATELFDPTRGIKFSTYATYWVRAKIGRHIADVRRHTMHVVMHGALSVPETTPVKSMRARKHFPRATMRSLDAPCPLQTEGDEITLLDRISSSDVPVDMVVAQQDENSWVIALLWRTCYEMDDPRMLVLARHRLLAAPGETLDQVGKRLDVSRECVRLLEARLIAGMRKRATMKLPLTTKKPPTT
jgi:RNA polymerase sigma factor (sigma-70 family)